METTCVTEYKHPQHLQSQNQGVKLPTAMQTKSLTIGRDNTKFIL